VGRFFEMNAGTGACTSKPNIPDQVIAKWQKTADLISEVFSVPAALVMKVHLQEIEVFVSSDSEGNPFEKGQKGSLNRGLYCERVMAQCDQLLVPDARKDREWVNNPDMRFGMVSYLGLPLIWPDGETFGTLAVLDNKENSYSVAYQKLLGHFREVIETDLRMVLENVERTERAE